MSTINQESSRFDAISRAPSARSQCLEVYRRLLAADSADPDIRMVLETLADVLADLVRTCGGDADIAVRLSDIRTMVDAHLLATFQLTEAGADPGRTSDVLRRAYRQACADLGLLVGQR
jgi:hypothetical protein